jgi:SAM-dependent methyltransferase
MVEYLVPAQASEFPEQWYELSRPDHFWLQWRLAAALGQISDVGIAVERPLRVLDVGGGGGALREQLEGATAWTIDVGDLNAAALARVRESRGRTLCYDVLRPHPDLLAAYDVVLLFDVLEHVEDRRPFLEATLRHVKPGGFLLLNVPAWQFLYGAYDVAAGHRRRYRKATLAAELAGADCDVRDMRYWGLLMVPLLLLRRWTVRRAESDGDCVRRGFQPPGALVHAVLRAAGRTEAKLLRHPPMGSSLLLAAQRRAQPERSRG